MQCTMQFDTPFKESKNVQNESQTNLPPLVSEALVQTDGFTSENESCQTEISDGKDFEVQVDIRPDENSISTQTIKQENNEIAMPNRPSSMVTAVKSSKKRKLSSQNIWTQTSITDSIQSKQSEIDRLKLENRKLESSEQSCKNDLKNLKTKLTLIEERYNLLLESKFILNCLSHTN